MGKREPKEEGGEGKTATCSRDIMLECLQKVQWQGRERETRAAGRQGSDCDHLLSVIIY